MANDPGTVKHSVDLKSSPPDPFAAVCGLRKWGISFVDDRDQITCLDCRAALGLRIGTPDEGSGVDLWKLGMESEAREELRRNAANKLAAKQKG